MLDGGAMDPGLGLPQASEDGQALLLDRALQGAAVDDLLDVVEMAVGVVVMMRCS